MHVPTSEPVIAQLVERRTVVVIKPEMLRSLVQLWLAGGHIPFTVVMNHPIVVKIQLKRGIESLYHPVNATLNNLAGPHFEK